ncbi:hypothetical protein BESB_056740 [Besnoitia besnoiti]|uniref:SWIM-type domain-containing protein n=1 Tax=Besnoitia besnoiti TaxID=94643 RepID=A0A2A9MK30_BESBE|nr:hypothetical protein BESB_056740 [Besnoitia besnoiti]PFH36023.1 hypothetical protein BESB_056740 [Besnoitia besnoiti]
MSNPPQGHGGYGGGRPPRPPFARFPPSSAASPHGHFGAHGARSAPLSSSGPPPPAPPVNWRHSQHAYAHPPAQGWAHERGAPPPPPGSGQGAFGAPGASWASPPSGALHASPLAHRPSPPLSAGTAAARGPSTHGESPPAAPSGAPPPRLDGPLAPGGRAAPQAFSSVPSPSAPSHAPPFCSERCPRGQRRLRPPPASGLSSAVSAFLQTARGHGDSPQTGVAGGSGAPRPLGPEGPPGAGRATGAWGGRRLPEEVVVVIGDDSSSEEEEEILLRGDQLHEGRAQQDVDTSASPPPPGARSPPARPAAKRELSPCWRSPPRCGTDRGAPAAPRWHGDVDRGARRRPRGARGLPSGRGRGEETGRGDRRDGGGGGNAEQEAARALAIQQSRLLLRCEDLRWSTVPEFRCLVGKSLNRGVLSKAQRIAAMEDGIRQTEEDDMTLVVHSDSSNCRFVDLAVCECSCPNHAPPCSHLTAAVLWGSSADRLQFALMTLLKLRFLNPFADRRTAFVALSSGEQQLSFAAIQRFVRAHFARLYTPDEVADAALRAAVGLLLRFFQRAQGSLPPLPSTVEHVKKVAQDKEESDDDEEEDVEEGETETPNAAKKERDDLSPLSSSSDSSEDDEERGDDRAQAQIGPCPETAESGGQEAKKAAEEEGDCASEAEPAGAAGAGEQAKPRRALGSPLLSFALASNAQREKVLFSILAEVQRLRQDRKRGLLWTDEIASASSTARLLSADAGNEEGAQRRMPGMQGRLGGTKRQRQALKDLKDMVQCLAALESRVAERMAQAGRYEGEEMRDVDTPVEADDHAASSAHEDGRKSGAESFLRALLSLPDALQAVSRALLDGERSEEAAEEDARWRRRWSTDTSEVDEGEDASDSEEGRQGGKKRGRRGRGEGDRSASSWGVSEEAEADAERREELKQKTDDEIAILTFFLSEAFPGLFSHTPTSARALQRTGASSSLLSSASSAPSLDTAVRIAERPPKERFSVYRLLHRLHLPGFSLSRVTVSDSSGSASLASFPSKFPSSLQQAERLAAAGRRALGLPPVSLGEVSDSETDDLDDGAAPRATWRLSVEGQARLRDLHGAAVLPAVCLLPLDSLVAPLSSPAEDASLGLPSALPPLRGGCLSPPPMTQSFSPSASDRVSSLSPAQVAFLVATAPPLVDLNAFLGWEQAFASRHGSLLAFIRRHLHMPLLPLGGRDAGGGGDPPSHNSACTLASSSFFLLLDLHTLARLPRAVAPPPSSLGSPLPSSAGVTGESEGEDLPPCTRRFFECLEARRGREAAVWFLSSLCAQRSGRDVLAAASRGPCGVSEGGGSSFQHRLQAQWRGPKAAHATPEVSGEAEGEAEGDRDARDAAAFALDFLLSLPAIFWPTATADVVAPLANCVGRARFLAGMERMAYAAWFPPSSSLASSAMTRQPAAPAASCGLWSAVAFSGSPTAARAREGDFVSLPASQCVALERAFVLCAAVLAEPRGGDGETGDEVGSPSLLERHVKWQLLSRGEEAALETRGDAAATEGRRIVAEESPPGPVSFVTSGTSSTTPPPRQAAGAVTARAEPSRSSLLSPPRGAPAPSESVCGLESPPGASSSASPSPSSPASETQSAPPAERLRCSSSHEDEELLLSRPLFILPGATTARGGGRQAEGVGDTCVSSAAPVAAAAGSLRASVPFHVSPLEEPGGDSGSSRLDLVAWGDGGLLPSETEAASDSTGSLACPASFSRQREIIEAIRKEEFGVGLELPASEKASEGETGSESTDAPPLTEEERETQRRSRQASELVADVLRRQRERLTRALDRLSRGLYTADSHLQMELIQNADDNNYSVLGDLQRSAGTIQRGSAEPASPPASLAQPALHFEVTLEGLAAFNNENGFTERDVRAICDVARSTKASRENGADGAAGARGGLGATGARAAGGAPATGQSEKEKGGNGAKRAGGAGIAKKIGKFGLGFKSVFAISDRPHLFSQGFSFKFEASDPTGLGFVLPHWLDPAEFAVYLPPATLYSAFVMAGGPGGKWRFGALPAESRRATLVALTAPSPQRTLGLPPSSLASTAGPTSFDRGENGLGLEPGRSRLCRQTEDADTQSPDDVASCVHATSSGFRVCPQSGSAPAYLSSAPALAACASALRTTWRTIVWLPLKASLLSGAGAERWRAPGQGLGARLAALCAEELLFLRKLTRLSSCLHLVSPPRLSIVEKHFVPIDPRGMRDTTKKGTEDAANGNALKGRGACGARHAAEHQHAGVCQPPPASQDADRHAVVSETNGGERHTVQRVRLVSVRFALPRAETVGDTPGVESATPACGGETLGPRNPEPSELECRAEDWILVRREFSLWIPRQDEDDESQAASRQNAHSKQDLEQKRTELVIALPLLPCGRAAAPVFGRPQGPAVESRAAPCYASAANAATSPAAPAEGLSAVPESRPVFCYLPIRSFGLPFVLHAPFDLTASRESLVVSSAYNLLLRSSLPHSFLAALRFCKASGIFALQASFLRFLPFAAAAESDFFAPPAREILRLLRSQECIMAIDPAEGASQRHEKAPRRPALCCADSFAPTACERRRREAESGGEREGGAEDGREFAFTWAKPTQALLLPSEAEAARDDGDFAGKKGLGGVKDAEATEGGGGGDAAPKKCSGGREAGESGADGVAGQSRQRSLSCGSLQMRLVSPRLLQQRLNLFYVHPAARRETGEEALRRLGVRAFSLWDAVEFLRAVVACAPPEGPEDLRLPKAAVEAGRRGEQPASASSGAAEATRGEDGESGASWRPAEEDEACAILSPAWVGLFLCFLDELAETGDYTREEIRVAFDALKGIPFLPTTSGLRVAASLRKPQRGAPGVRCGGDVALTPSIYVLAGGEDGEAEEGDDALFASARRPVSAGAPSRLPFSAAGNNALNVSSGPVSAVSSRHGVLPARAQGRGETGGDRAGEEEVELQRTQREIGELVRILSPAVFQPFRRPRGMGSGGDPGDSQTETQGGEETSVEDDARALQRVRVLRSLHRLGLEKAGSLQLISSRVLPLLLDADASRDLPDSVLLSLLAFLALNLEEARTALALDAGAAAARAVARRRGEEGEGREGGRLRRPSRRGRMPREWDDGLAGTARRRDRPFLPDDEDGEGESDVGGARSGQLWRQLQILTAAGQRVALGDWRVRLPACVLAAGADLRETADQAREGARHSDRESGDGKKHVLQSLLGRPHALELSPRYFEFAPLEAWVAFFSLLGLTNVLPVQTVVYELSFVSQSASPATSRGAEEPRVSEKKQRKKREKRGKEERQGTRGAAVRLRLLQIEDQRLLPSKQPTVSVSSLSSPSRGAPPAETVVRSQKGSERERGSAASLKHLLDCVAGSRSQQEWLAMLAARCGDRADRDTRPEPKSSDAAVVGEGLEAAMEDAQGAADNKEKALQDEEGKAQQGGGATHVATANAPQNKVPREPGKGGSAPSLRIVDFVSIDFDMICDALSDAEEERERALVLSEIVRRSWATRVRPFLGAECSGVPAEPEGCTDAPGVSSALAAGSSSIPSAIPSCFLLQLRTRRWLPACEVVRASEAHELARARRQAGARGGRRGRPSEGRTDTVSACDPGATRSEKREEDEPALPSVTVVVDVDGELSSDAEDTESSASSADDDNDDAKPLLREGEKSARKRRRGCRRASPERGATAALSSHSKKLRAHPPSAAASRGALASPSSSSRRRKRGRSAPDSPSRRGAAALSPSASASRSPSPASSAAEAALGRAGPEDNDGREHRKRLPAARFCLGGAEDSEQRGEDESEPGDDGRLRWIYTGLAAPVALQAPSHAVLAVYGHLVRFLDPRAWQLWAGATGKEELREGERGDRRQSEASQSQAATGGEDAAQPGEGGGAQTAQKANCVLGESLDGSSIPRGLDRASNVLLSPVSPVSPSAASRSPLCLLGVGTRPSVGGALALLQALGRCLSCCQLGEETAAEAASTSGVLAACQQSSSCGDEFAECELMRPGWERAPELGIDGERDEGKSGPQRGWRDASGPEESDRRLSLRPSLPTLALWHVRGLQCGEGAGCSQRLAGSPGRPLCGGTPHSPSASSPEDVLAVPFALYALRERALHQAGCSVRPRRLACALDPGTQRAKDKRNPFACCQAPLPSSPASPHSPATPLTAKETVPPLAEGCAGFCVCWACFTVLDYVSRLLFFLAEAAHLQRGVPRSAPSPYIQGQENAGRRRRDATPDDGQDARAAVALAASSWTSRRGGGASREDAPRLLTFLRSCLNPDGAQRSPTLFPFPSQAVQLASATSATPAQSRLSAAAAAGGAGEGAEASSCLHWVSVGDVFWATPPGVAEDFFASSSFLAFLTKTLLHVSEARREALQAEAAHPRGRTRRAAGSLTAGSLTAGSVASRDASSASSPEERVVLALKIDCIAECTYHAARAATSFAASAAVAPLPSLLRGDESKEGEPRVREVRNLLVDVAGMPTGPSLALCLDALLRLTGGDEGDGRTDREERKDGEEGERSASAGRAEAEGLRGKKKPRILRREKKGSCAQTPSGVLSSSQSSARPSESPPLSAACIRPDLRRWSPESQATQAILLLLYFACELLHEREKRASSGRRVEALAARRRVSRPPSDKPSSAPEIICAAEGKSHKFLQAGAGASPHEQSEEDNFGKSDSTELRRSSEATRQSEGAVDALEARQRQEEKEEILRKLRSLLWDLPVVPTCLPAPRLTILSVETPVSCASGGDGEHLERESRYGRRGDSHEFYEAAETPARGERQRRPAREEEVLQRGIRWAAPQDGLSLLASGHDVNIWKTFASLFSSRSSGEFSESPSPGGAGTASARRPPASALLRLRSRLAWLPEADVTVEQAVEREACRRARVCVSRSTASRSPLGSNSLSSSGGLLEAAVNADAALGLLELLQGLSRLFPEDGPARNQRADSIFSNPFLMAQSPSASPAAGADESRVLRSVSLRRVWTRFLREAFAAQAFHEECILQVSSALPAASLFASLLGANPLPPPCASSVVSADARETRASSRASRAALSLPSASRTSCASFLASLPAGGVSPLAQSSSGADASGGLASVSLGRLFSPPLPLSAMPLFFSASLKRLVCCALLPCARRYLLAREPGVYRFLTAETHVEKRAKKGGFDAAACADSARLDSEHLQWLYQREGGRVTRRGQQPPARPQLTASAAHANSSASPAPSLSHRGPPPPFLLRFVALPPGFFEEFSRLFAPSGEALKSLATFLHLCYTVQLQCLLSKQLEGKGGRRKRAATPDDPAGGERLLAALGNELNRVFVSQGLPPVAGERRAREAPAEEAAADARGESGTALRTSKEGQEGESGLDFVAMYKLCTGDEEGDAREESESARLLWQDAWVQEALKEEDQLEYAGWIHQKRGSEGKSGGQSAPESGRAPLEEESGADSGPLEGFAESEEDETTAEGGRRDRRSKVSSCQRTRKEGEAQIGDEEEQGEPEDEIDSSLQPESEEGESLGARAPQRKGLPEEEERRPNDGFEDDSGERFGITDMDRHTVPHIFGGLLNFEKEGMTAELSARGHANLQDGAEDAEVVSLDDDNEKAQERGGNLDENRDATEDRGGKCENDGGIRDVVQLGAFSAEDLTLPPGFHHAMRTPRCLSAENVAPSAIRDRLGRRGEEIAFLFLSQQFESEIAEGRCRVLWVNEDEEKGTPYDILVTKYGAIGSSAPPETLYVEVKATGTQTKSFFEVSHKEWQFAQQHGEKFHIYRVLDAGSETPRILRIVNPYRQWRDNRIGICIAL